MHFTHEYRSLVKAEQIDLYGHVNNTQYLQILEAARWDWTEQFGGSRELVKELGVGPIVIEIQIQFRRELKVGDEIFIKSQREFPRKVYLLEQEIFNAKNELVCKAKFKMGFMNLETRRLVDLPPKWRDVFEEKNQVRV